MNDSKLKILVAEAVVLDRQKAEIEKLIKKIKAQLIAEADSRPDEHTETDGGGSRVRFEGADGCVAVITFPSPTLKSKIDGEGKTWDKIKTAAGHALRALFMPAVSYHPIPNFREMAREVLGRDAAKLIKLCETETTPKVSFETADKQVAQK